MVIENTNSKTNPENPIKTEEALKLQSLRESEDKYLSLLRL